MDHYSSLVPPLASDGPAAWLYDPEARRMLWANSAALRLWGVSSLSALPARRDLADSVQMRLHQLAGPDDEVVETWTVAGAAGLRRLRVRSRLQALPDGRRALLHDLLPAGNPLDLPAPGAHEAARAVDAVPACAAVPEPTGTSMAREAADDPPPMTAVAQAIALALSGLADLAAGSDPLRIPSAAPPAPFAPADLAGPLRTLLDLLDGDDAAAMKRGADGAEDQPVRDLVADLVRLLTPAARRQGGRLVLEVGSGVPHRLVVKAGPLRHLLLVLLSALLRQGGRGAALRLEYEDGLRLTIPGRPPPLPRELEALLAAAGATVEVLPDRLVLRLSPADSPSGSSAPADAAAAHPAAPPVRHRQARVLVVDDNPVNRLLLATRLQKAGHTVETADSGEAALAATAATGFDIVFMDLRMPGMDGLEASRQIRQRPGGGAVRIVGVSADGYPGPDGGWCRDGMDAFLVKPVSAEDVAAQVDLALDRDAACLDADAVAALREALGPDQLATLMGLLAGMIRRELPSIRQAVAERHPPALHSLRGAAANLGALRFATALRALGEADPDSRPGLLCRLDCEAERLLRSLESG